MNAAQTLSPSLSAGRPPPRADGLSMGQQRAVIGAIVALHIGLAYGLLQVQAVRDAVTEAAPIFVSLLTPPAPPAPVPVPPPPPTPRVVPKKTAPPPAPVITAAPSPAPTTFTAPPPPPVIEPLAPIAPPAPPAPPVEVAVQAPPAPAPPKMIPASAVQYLERAEPAYPPTSVRMRESGRPVVRVLIDEGGLPRTVQVYQSSGFVRLDESCIAALKKSRFKPYTENGQATAGWALAPCNFDL